MKMNISHGFFAFFAVALLSQSATEASIITQTDPQSGGILYRWTVTAGLNDSASLTRHVGAWAWEDSSLFLPGQTPVGWTHNSDWIAFRLEADAYVTLTLGSAEGVPLPPSSTAGTNLIPGMTIYSGWDNDLAPQEFIDANSPGEPVGDWHSYVNRGDIEWAEDTQYFAHLEPNGTHFVETTLFMEAGDYTIVVGGRSLSTAAEGRQGYQATFTTSTVPEPGSAVVALIGGTVLLGRRRKRGC